MIPPARILSTAEERRAAVLEAAEHVFAERGYHGTPTTEIAKAAGISQAYLFRLFPTKLELFVTLVDRCFARTADIFSAAARRARSDGEDVLEAMGLAYHDLLQDRDALLLQLHAYTATGLPEVQAAVRRGFGSLFELAARESGAGDEAVRTWLAQGMLLNVVAAMRADELDEPWAQSLCRFDPKG